MRKVFLIAFVFMVILLSFGYIASKEETNQNINNSEESGLYKATHNAYIANIELPCIDSNNEIITHYAYSLCYSEQHEQALWVAYQLKGSRLSHAEERSNKFKVDPMVKTGSATDRDYKGSGFDRGHLAPAADMSWSKISMQESFFFSNISPQNSSFNRGIWKRLETLVRNWALELDSIYVVTGPVLSDNLDFIGENKVSVPKYYYKVILSYSENRVEGIGFVIKNEPSKEPLQNYAVSIDSVETLTGIDFFCNLPNSLETRVELQRNIHKWTWNTNNTKIK